jgi:Na+/proline symporter
MSQKLYKLGAKISVLPMLFLPAAVSAAGLEAPNQTADSMAAEGTFEEFIGNAINAVLGALGIIFLCLVLYAGFEYLTAMDDVKKTQKAKTLLINATIGLAIILAAYAITRFIIGALITAKG